MHTGFDVCTSPRARPHEQPSFFPHVLFVAARAGPVTSRRTLLANEQSSRTMAFDRPSWSSNWTTIAHVQAVLTKFIFLHSTMGGSFHAPDQSASPSRPAPHPSDSRGGAPTQRWSHERLQHLPLPRLTDRAGEHHPLAALPRGAPSPHRCRRHRGGAAAFLPRRHPARHPTHPASAGGGAGHQRCGCRGRTVVAARRARCVAAPLRLVAPPRPAVATLSVLRWSTPF